MAYANRTSRGQFQWAKGRRGWRALEQRRASYQKEKQLRERFIRRMEKLYSPLPPFFPLNLRHPHVREDPTVEEFHDVKWSPDYRVILA